MIRTLIISGSLLAAIGIILGALGAHALSELLEPGRLEAFKTGSRYQIYHALALIAMAGISKYITEKGLIWVFRLMLTGVVLFSGSIYLLSTKEVHGINMAFLGPITPLGGLLMISSWVVLLFSLKKEVD